jgi:hypothetical protein
LRCLNANSYKAVIEVALRLDKRPRFGKLLALPMKPSVTAGMPLVRGQNVQASPRRRFFDYQRLFSVAIRHEFYGRGHIESGLFQVAPTPRTAARLAALGMVFRSERDGFSVVCDNAQSWQARAQTFEASEALTFEVVCTDPDFVSITAIDLATSPRATPFHFSNRIDSPPATSAGRGRAGATAEPVFVPLRAQLRYEAPPGALVRASSDFRPTPIAVVEIVLGGGDSPGACPMPPVDGAHGSSPVFYEMVFEARKVFWRYHIVPQAGSGPLDNLTIDSAMFHGPFPETLINGDEGHRFLSKEPMALANLSNARWSLQGRRRARMTRDAMLVERLPVPAASHVCLLAADERELLGVEDGVCAEMFVYV